MSFRSFATGAAARAATVVAVLATCVLPPAASAASLPVTSVRADDPCLLLTQGALSYPTDGAERVTFATADSYDETSVLITGCAVEGEGYAEEWQTSGYIGVNGFAPEGELVESSLQSPSGSFTMTEALGRSDPGTELEYYTLNPWSRWGGEHGPNYNQYFEGEDRGADENLWWYMEQGPYEQAAVINWNRPPDMPTVQGASFAIFLHAGNSETVGCISTDLDTVTRLLQNATPGDRIVMGVEDEVFTVPAPDSGTAADSADKAVALGRWGSVAVVAAVGLVLLGGGVIVVRAGFRGRREVHRDR